MWYLGDVLVGEAGGKGEGVNFGARSAAAHGGCLLAVLGGERLHIYVS